MDCCWSLSLIKIDIKYLNVWRLNGSSIFCNGLVLLGDMEIAEVHVDLEDQIAELI